MLEEFQLYVACGLAFKPRDQKCHAMSPSYRTRLANYREASAFSNCKPRSDISSGGYHFPLKYKYGDLWSSRIRWYCRLLQYLNFYRLFHSCDEQGRASSPFGQAPLTSSSPNVDLQRTLMLGSVWHTYVVFPTFRHGFVSRYICPL